MGRAWEYCGNTVSILWEYCSRKHYGNSMERPRECHGNTLGTRIMLVYWGNALRIAREFNGNTMGIARAYYWKFCGSTLGRRYENIMGILLEYYGNSLGTCCEYSGSPVETA